MLRPGVEEPETHTRDVGEGAAAADAPLARDPQRLVELLRPFDAAVLLEYVRDADVLPGVPLS